MIVTECFKIDGGGLQGQVVFGRRRRQRVMRSGTEGVNGRHGRLFHVFCGQVVSAGLGAPNIILTPCLRQMLLGGCWPSSETYTSGCMHASRVGDGLS
jgi:hypothetical protein